MVLDAEYNQPSHKCIQIGAAVFDVRSADLIDRFEIYVNPEEPINPFITELTGVTDKNVENAVSIRDAYRSLESFHKKHKCFRNPLVWGSGVRNDSLAIWQETGLTEDNFMGFRVIDAKTLYQSVALFENKQYAGGLKESMRKLGLEFEGAPHQALTDAINTFRIWYYLVRKMHDGFVVERKKKND
jgi:inhibitor of KinA sporulation pathway (predicted exonuclease)